MPESTYAARGACEFCTLGNGQQPGPGRLTGTIDFFANLFNTDGFPPRWECGTAWTPGHGWLHIVSDFAIFGAYFAIPVVLAYFILRRKDIPLPPILWLFVAFIALCGFGHLIEGTLFWTPWYRLSGLIKAMTAVVSWVTVIALIQFVPGALHLPGLATINAQLAEEVAERTATEEKLKESYDELQVFTRSVFDREERMIELKREVNSLLTELGRDARYGLEETKQ